MNRLSRRQYLAVGAGALCTGLAGCAGADGDAANLVIVDERYNYSEPEGYGTWHATVENTGDRTNVLASVGIAPTGGEDEGEVTERYERTGVIDGGEEGDIAVTNAHYMNTGDYEFRRNIERTDRPHADFEVRYPSEPTIEADASAATSVESSVASYEWAAHEFEWVESGPALDWNLPDGEVVAFEPPDPEDFFADVVLTVTDEEGREDVFRESVSDSHASSGWE